VAVLINKAMIEIPPMFAGRPPVNADARAEIARSGGWHGKGAQGLATDVRYYGQWMRDEAEKRVGQLYPPTLHHLRAQETRAGSPRVPWPRAKLA
jgi:putative DNA methylase